MKERRKKYRKVDEENGEGEEEERQEKRKRERGDTEMQKRIEK